MQINSIMSSAQRPVSTLGANPSNRQQHFGAYITPQQIPDFADRFDAGKPLGTALLAELERAFVMTFGPLGRAFSEHMRSFPNRSQLIDALITTSIVNEHALMSPQELVAVVIYKDQQYIVTEAEFLQLFSLSPQDLQSQGFQDIRVLIPGEEPFTKLELPLTMDDLYDEDEQGSTQQKYWAEIASTYNSQHQGRPPAYDSPELVEAFYNLQERLIEEGKLDPAFRLGTINPNLMPK